MMPTSRLVIPLAALAFALAATELNTYPGSRHDNGAHHRHHH